MRKLFITSCLLSTFAFQSSLAQAGWRDRLASAAEAAKAKCEVILDASLSKAEAALEQADEGMTNLSKAFDSFVESVNFEGVAEGASGGAAGVKALFWKTVSFTALAKMVGRIYQFDTDVDSLRVGMFGQMTDYINRLCIVNQECAVVSTEEAVRKRVEIYGELILLVFEMSFKAYKFVPETVVAIVPTGFGMFIPVVVQKDPKTVDQLAGMVIKQFLVNAFKALTSRGLSLEERMMLLNQDLLMLDVSKKFAQDAGIADFVAALRKLSGSGGQQLLEQTK